MRYSIILPVRNGGNYVKECIQSILRQTLPDFNLLVLDSGSTDGTIEWISSLNDKRIIIHLADRPLTIEENWGRIKDVPKNKFMTMIGYDDILLPAYLQTMDNLIRKHPGATLYQAHFNYIDENGKLVRACFPMDEKQHAHDFLAAQMKRSIDSTGTGYMMRSEDYDKAGGIPVHYPNLIYADFELWLTLMLKGYKATSPETCFLYRLHQSVSRTTNGMLYQQAFVKYITFLTGIQQNNDQLNDVVQQNGKNFLLFNCESLSHRLLKTPVDKRSIKVADFINICCSLAATFIPGQDFKPLDIFRIRIAKQLDNSSFGRFLFRCYKLFA